MTKSPGEFELIARITAKLRQSRRTILGPGDDCAVLGRPRAAQLITIDSMVEGVHFKLAWITPEALGARAVTVNLSDIAAMGGVPTACVVNLAIRPGLDPAFSIGSMPASPALQMLPVSMSWAATLPAPMRSQLRSHC